MIIQNDDTHISQPLCVCVYNLQVCVSLCQQALDLFGHGAEHQV